MDLAQFPRKRYTTAYTPIEKLHHLSEVLGGPSIYMKRDDLLGLTAGGNKTRKSWSSLLQMQRKKVRIR